jgi:hypothetical protein
VTDLSLLVSVSQSRWRPEPNSVATNRCDTAGVRRCRVLPATMVKQDGVGLTAACMGITGEDTVAPGAGVGVVGEVRLTECWERSCAPYLFGTGGARMRRQPEENRRYGSPGPFPRGAVNPALAEEARLGTAQIFLAALTRVGHSITCTSHPQRNGTGQVRLTPDWSTYTVLPWRRTHAVVLAHLREATTPAGQPGAGDTWALCPRATLQRLCQVRADGGSLRIGRLGFWHGGDREWPLNEGQRPNCRGERVALGTGYNHGRGIGRAWRNSRASCRPPPEIPNVTIRNLFIAVRRADSSA